jgi:hypothetical protein
LHGQHRHPHQSVPARALRFDICDGFFEKIAGATTHHQAAQVTACRPTANGIFKRLRGFRVSRVKGGWSNQ